MVKQSNEFLLTFGVYPVMSSFYFVTFMPGVYPVKVTLERSIKTETKQISS